MIVWQNRIFHGCLARRSYLRATRKTQLSPSILTLRIPVMCKTHASFREMLSRELPIKTLQSSICLSLHTHTHALSLSLSFSLSQPLQLNPTINIWYKILNKITIKFVTELKPTKQIVVNYNFTISPFDYSVQEPEFCLVQSVQQDLLLQLLE